MNVFFWSPDSSMENVPYNLPGLPVYILEDHLFNSPNQLVLPHWHPDLEFVMILEGSILYTVNGKTQTVHAGEMIFANAGSLHSARLENEQDCRFFSLLADPSLLCTSELIAKEFVLPVVECQELSGLILRENNPEHEKAFRLLKGTMRRFLQQPDALRLQRDLFAFWELFYHLVCTRLQPSRHPDLERIQSMIVFLQEHYHEDLSVEQIAAAGNVGTTVCTELFRTYTGAPPKTYLTRLRLFHAQNLLCRTDLPVTEIAMKCGFGSPAAFSRTFKKCCTLSPLAYRSEHSNDKPASVLPGSSGSE